MAEYITTLHVLDTDFTADGTSFEDNAITTMVITSDGQTIGIEDDIETFMQGSGDDITSTDVELTSVDGDQYVIVNGATYNIASDGYYSADGDDGVTYNFVVVDIDYDGDGVYDGDGDSQAVIFFDNQTINDTDYTPPAISVTLTNIEYLAPGGLIYSLLSESVDDGTIEETLLTCFGQDTLIKTAQGDRSVQTLNVGDKVITSESIEPSIIRWIGSREVIFDGSLPNEEKLRPVRITAGALGGGLPKRDLLVSRQHRMLVKSSIVERMFGTREVLVPAIKLIEMPGIFIDMDVKSITYFHILFDKHEIIYADGAPSESFFTGSVALNGIEEQARDEIFELFPKLAQHNYIPNTARIVPTHKQQKQLIARHAQNNRKLIQIELI